MTVSSINLKAAHKEFLDFLKEKGRASATILAYGSDLQQLIDFFQKSGKTTADQINKNDLEDFKKNLTKEGYTPKSISRKINSIRTFFKILVTNKIIKESPANSLTHPKYETKPPRILSRMEYRALRDACRNDIRINSIIELFLQTGVRIGELSNLEVDDIKDKMLNIKPYESQGGREIPLNPAVKSSLEAYLKVRPKSKSKTLFLTKSGKSFLIRNIRGAIDRYFKLAGIKDSTVNDLRHTFISHQLKAGVPLVLISKIVGHKRLSTTEKYLKFIKEKSSQNLKLKEL
ncbi:tyrosine-type recombinase/integrase [Patescibacteria group bacterium]